MKTSKVTKVEFKGEGSNNFGTTYGFWIEMENGDKGYYNSKKNPQTFFNEGQNADYTVEEKEKKGGGGTYLAIKPYREQKTFYDKGGKSKSSNASFALSYAKDYFVAHCPHESAHEDANTITAVADIFLKWLNDND